ncbi:MAG: glycosyltransferase [Nitrospirae bacterium]|nr:glycosyltransferase [Nitrospirota bacterium]
MNIVLNFIGLRSGGGRADTFNLMMSIPANAPEHNFLAIVPARHGYENIAVSANCKVLYEPVRTFNDAWRVYFDNVVTPAICKDFKADLLFTMGNNGPVKFKYCKHIMMLRMPQLIYPFECMGDIDLKMKIKIYFLKQYMKRALPHADAVIVQTDTINKRIRNIYDIKGPVYVVGKNVTRSMKLAGNAGIDNQQVREICGNESKMKLLYIADYYPHKNMRKACEAMALLRKRGVDVTLFLTIDSTKNSNSLLKDIEAGKYGKGVISLGHVDYSNIQGIYRCCDAVLMPSHLESFSATYLEAMAFSKPLMVSDLDFAHEICGDAALYFDPYNAVSMADTVVRLLSEPSLGQRCIEKGKEQYAKYNISWDEIAKRYIDIFLKTCKIDTSQGTT